VAVRGVLFEMVSPVLVERFWQARQMGLTDELLGAEVGLSERGAAKYAARCGGLAPRPWKNLDRLLSFEERCRIKELLVEGKGVRAIARALDRSPSTISRELRRVGACVTAPSQYRPRAAHRIAWERRRRPKPSKILDNQELRLLVQQGLDKKHSPEQISGRLRRDFPDREDLQVCHETIYRSIYLQARGGLKRELKALTRTGRTMRRPQRKAGQRRSRLPEMVSIWDRPAEALERVVPGHWEGDLIIGEDGKSAIATIVERVSNFTILCWIDPERNRAEATRDALVKQLGRLPDQLRQSLTWDQGLEMWRHPEISVAADIDIYFADPHAPWQRATNENTNGLLRQYFPKGTDLSRYSQEDLDFVADELNRRPRRRLEFATPYEVLSEHLLLQ